MKPLKKFEVKQAISDHIADHFTNVSTFIYNYFKSFVSKLLKSYTGKTG